MKAGDKVVTASGIRGLVISVKDNTVSLSSIDAKMEVIKASVTEILESGTAPKSSHHEAKQSLEIHSRHPDRRLVALRNLPADFAQPLAGQFTSRAENTDAAFTNILERLAPLDAGAARPRVRQSVGGHRHERHPELFSVHHREESTVSDDLHLEPVAARRVGQDQAGPGFAGRHVVPRRDGHERAGELPRTMARTRFRARRM